MKQIYRLLLPAFLLIHYTIIAQKPAGEVDYSTFAKEITQSSYKEQRMKMAVWMPTVYWSIIAEQHSAITPEVLKQIVEMVDDYTIICVVDATMDLETNRFVPLPESALRKQVALKVGGKTIKPLYNNELSDDALQIKNIIEPVFAKMLGDLGNGMTILYFRSKDEKGNYIADPYGTTDFTIDLGGELLTYDLPLPSLLHDKICPEDNATFPSNYTYCPFHGKELRDPQAMRTSEEKAE